jgi:hypothetical protein
MLRAVERSKTMLEQLQGYDYDPSAQPAEEDYPDDSVSQLEYGDYDYDHRATGRSRLSIGDCQLKQYGVKPDLCLFADAVVSACCSC